MAGTAVGARRRRAGQLGITLEEYEAKLAAGERWCTGCKDTHPADRFGSDAYRPDGLAATCREAVNERKRRNYQSRPRTRYGPEPQPPRDGDRLQARQRINVEVRTGRRPHPNTLPCTDCGHVWQPGERRHEYDHHLGYAPEHHLDVEPVCTKCHRARADQRGETRQVRGERGRFVAPREVMCDG